MTTAQPGSTSIEQPDYWWYRARSRLLRAALGRYVQSPRRVLDVGSADGPSVSWLEARQLQVSVDIDPRGLSSGQGVCASAVALPFASGTFDVVSAFDVIEHCADEREVLTELCRVLAGGGRMLLSVPAYQWAWSDHDVRAGHHRRYTRQRLVGSVRDAGLVVDRSTYGFGSVFPFFLAERAMRRIRHLRASEPRPVQAVSDPVDRTLMSLCRLEERLLGRYDIGFGSSVFLAATKPVDAS